jgi:GxxExxY protein
MNDADLPHLVIGACLNVHGCLGPGLFREAYEECMAIELRELEIDFRRAVPLDFTYREHEVKNAAKLDFIVQERLLLIVRSQEQVTALEKQQFESILRLSGLRGGLLVNFNVPVLRKGLHRVMLKRREN